jgi:hypothetical protein
LGLLHMHCGIKIWFIALLFCIQWMHFPSTIWHRIWAMTLEAAFVFYCVADDF